MKRQFIAAVLIGAAICYACPANAQSIGQGCVNEANSLRTLKSVVPAEGVIECVPDSNGNYFWQAMGAGIARYDTTATCSIAGSLRWNGTSVQYCDGVNWQGLGGSGFPKSHGVISASVSGGDENGTGIATWCYAQTDANGHPLIYQCTAGTGCWGWGYSTFNQQVFWSGKGKSAYSWYFACSVTAAGLSAAGPNNWSAFVAW